MENTYKLTEEEVRQLNPLVLASVGDGVYSLLVRAFLAANHDFNANVLHKNAAKYVCAVAQKNAYFKIEDQLDEDEAYFARRGRNMHPGTVPKNADILDYRTATALETVFGYLYMTNKISRMNKLFNIIMENSDEIR